jgi:hypothetical protein
MSPEDLKRQTKGFGLCVIRLLSTLPRSVANDVMGRLRQEQIIVLLAAHVQRMILSPK